MKPKVLLLSTYDLGHQPFALSSLSAWLKDAGAEVVCNDLAVDDLDEDAVKDAGLIGIHLAMHTATRLAIETLPTIRQLNPAAHVCFFGLYAPLNVERLAAFGPMSTMGGETEGQFVNLWRGLCDGEVSGHNHAATTEKLNFKLPDRLGLPGLDRYAYLTVPSDGPEAGERRIVGYTEASRGCKHLCRHCPVVPIYDGHFRIVPADLVLADIDQQVAAGAKHISFGDPDFFNGPSHGLKIVQALHEAHPFLTYDVTIKVEHLLKHAAHLDTLKETGCLYITTAVESVEDTVLGYLDKGHTREEFIEAANLARQHGLILSPTFVPFTPWTTLEGYRDLLETIAGLGLIDQVAPVQLAIRLLLPNGSRLLDIPEIKPQLGAFDPDGLSYTWRNPDPAVDALQSDIEVLVAEMDAAGATRREIFMALCNKTGIDTTTLPAALPGIGVPVMSENWYCCAEPTATQLARA